LRRDWIYRLCPGRRLDANWRQIAKIDRFPLKKALAASDPRPRIRWTHPPAA
jgi:hypothetical protein